MQTNVVELLKSPRPVLGVAGGNQRQPEAMARALRGDVLLRRPVVAIGRPYQIDRYARVLAEPHGRTHFCGEHTA